MVIFLYSDIKYEQAAISCIRSFERLITDDLKVVYYMVDFDSDFSCKNLHKVRVEKKGYPSMLFYKPELSLLTLQLFPEEEHFIYCDTDVIYSRKFDFTVGKIDNLAYPLAPVGPFDAPFIWENINGIYREYRCEELMNYLNVPERTMKYVNSCFYIFSHGCRDFIEEWASICENKYLHSRPGGILYFPFQDEASFNVLLWKRKAGKNLGRCYLNTTRLDAVKMCEEGYFEFIDPSEDRIGRQGVLKGGPVDIYGMNWESIEDPSNVIFYHGIKEKKASEEILNYIMSIT
jgi:hypothetical protein